jgi:hypothetical protein
MTDQHTGAGNRPAPPPPARSSSATAPSHRPPIRPQAHARRAPPQAMSGSLPELITAWGHVRAGLRRRTLELDRATALSATGPNPRPRRARQPRPRRERPAPSWSPAALESMTEEDWQARGNAPPPRAAVDPSSRSPTSFADALELAEEHVYRLVALLAMPNADVKRYRKRRLPRAARRARRRAPRRRRPTSSSSSPSSPARSSTSSFRARSTSSALDRLGNALRALGVEPRALQPQTSPQPPQTAPQPAPATTDGSATSTRYALELELDLIWRWADRFGWDADTVLDTDWRTLARPRRSPRAGATSDGATAADSTNTTARSRTSTATTAT